MSSKSVRNFPRAANPEIDLRCKAKNHGNDPESPRTLNRQSPHKSSQFFLEPYKREVSAPWFNPNQACRYTRFTYPRLAEGWKAELTRMVGYTDVFTFTATYPGTDRARRTR